MHPPYLASRRGSWTATVTCALKVARVGPGKGASVLLSVLGLSAVGRLPDPGHGDKVAGPMIQIDGRGILTTLAENVAPKPAAAEVQTGLS
jgi:hypothetical protein